MKSLGYVLVAVGALSITGCVTRERTVVRDSPPVVHERTVIQEAPPTVLREREVVAVSDVHRTWWGSYHPGEFYDASRAMMAHRLFCRDHPSDSTCAGWDWR